MNNAILQRATRNTEIKKITKMLAGNIPPLLTKKNLFLFVLLIFLLWILYIKVIVPRWDTVALYKPHYLPENCQEVLSHNATTYAQEYGIGQKATYACGASTLTIITYASSPNLQDACRKINQIEADQAWQQKNNATVISQGLNTYQGIQSCSYTYRNLSSESTTQYIYLTKDGHLVQVSISLPTPLSKTEVEQILASLNVN